MTQPSTLLRKLTRAIWLAACTTSLLATQVPAQSETWTTKAPMPTPRTAMAANVVDGKVYFVGGFVGHYSSDTLVYDPKTDSWETRAAMAAPREGAASAVVDRSLYVVGGHAGSGFLSTVEVYNPRTDTWAPKAPIPTPRS